MPKTPTKVEIIQEGDERFLLKVFADGSEERTPIVKLYRRDVIQKPEEGVLRPSGQTPMLAS